MKGPARLVTVGMPRSGTTLLASLLAAQPGARFVTDYLRTPLTVADRFGRRFDEPLPEAERRAALLLFREELVRIGHVTLLGPDDFGTIAELHERVLEELGDGTARLVGHKMVVPPRQLRALLEQGRLLLVMMVRDPRDAALSFWHRTGGGVEAFLEDWRAWARLAEALRGHPRFLALRFERLLTDPAAALAPLGERLGLELDWRSVRLHFDRGPRARVPLQANTAHGDVGEGIDPAPVERWRRRPLDPIVRYADWRCRREIRRLGYAPHPDPPQAPGELARHALRAAVQRADERLHRGLRLWSERIRPRLAPPLRPGDAPGGDGPRGERG